MRAAGPIAARSETTARAAFARLLVLPPKMALRPLIVTTGPKEVQRAAPIVNANALFLLDAASWLPFAAGLASEPTSLNL